MSDCSSVSVELSAARPRTMRRLRQDVLEDDGDAKAHHEAHAQGLDDALRSHNVEQTGSGAADDDAKVAQQGAGKPEATGAKPTRKPTESSMGEL